VYFVFPPWLSKVRTMDVIHGRPVNHCIRSAGSVQASKTFSGGASTTRLSESSRVASVAGAAGSKEAMNTLQLEPFGRDLF
jgi:hypothetical protein